MRLFQLINFLFVSVAFFVGTSISAYAKHPTTPVFEQQGEMGLYDTSVKFFRKSMGGVLVAKTNQDTVTLLLSAHMGMSILEASITTDSMIINHIMPAIDRPQVKEVLETDFRHLFLPTADARRITCKGGKEIRVVGYGLGKQKYSIFATEKRVQIKHPFGLRISLTQK